MTKHRCEGTEDAPVRLSTKLTAEERRAARVFDKAVKRWYRTLLIDPVWNVGLVVLDQDEIKHGDAYVDLGSSEYYTATICISRALLSLPPKELEKVASDVVCHELLHVLTADFQRAAITATGDNEKMQEEMRYRYEQVVSRLSMILSDLTEERKHVPAKGKDPGPADGVLPVPEMPTGDENG